MTLKKKLQLLLFGKVTHEGHGLNVSTYILRDGKTLTNQKLAGNILEFLIPLMDEDENAREELSP